MTGRAVSELGRQATQGQKRRRDICRGACNEGCSRLQLHQPSTLSLQGPGSGPFQSRAALQTITLETSRTGPTFKREGAASGATVAGVFTPILLVRPP